MATKTTISINKTTRAMLWEIMKKKDTYDSVIQRLVETAADLSPQELDEVQYLIGQMQQSQPTLTKEKVIGKLIKFGLETYKGYINNQSPKYEGE